MNARIDIKTPAGQSLEGFPRDGYCIYIPNNPSFNSITTYIDDRLDVSISNPILSSGNKITIEIL